MLDTIICYWPFYLENIAYRGYKGSNKIKERNCKCCQSTIALTLRQQINNELSEVYQTQQKQLVLTKLKV